MLTLLISFISFVCISQTKDPKSKTCASHMIVRTPLVTVSTNYRHRRTIVNENDHSYTQVQRPKGERQVSLCWTVDPSRSLGARARNHNLSRQIPAISQQALRWLPRARSKEMWAVPTKFGNTHTYVWKTRHAHDGGCGVTRGDKRRVVRRITAVFSRTHTHAR